MGLLGQIGGKPAETPIEDDKTYMFASGGLDKYMNELKTPKQAQDIDESEGLDGLIELQEKSISDEPLEKIKARTSVANASGKILSIALDTALPVALGLMLKDDPDNYKADDQEKEALTEAFTEYTKLKGGEIPPWLALVITILSIYGAKGFSGFQNKKLNDEKAKMQKRINELEEEAAKKLVEMDHVEEQI